ncbi:cache domain-containing protein [Caldalkalibacillus mannanilyticus]|uniref:cache domain-containing protein n=1 Tax=Caldalkalibacillus mannanilyticus TaxID=1418 RepID=UPI00068442BF|nr:cache domain-containing protein [Caldalkalibacillus mannanilyticus]
MNILQKMIRFHFLPNTSMTKKISVVFVFLIMIPMVILSYVSYESYSKNLQENTILYVSEISDKMLKRLDDDIDGMMKLSATPAYLGELQELLMLSNQSASESKRAEDRAAETELKSNIGLFAQMINNMKNETNSVYIFDNDGRVYMDVKTRGARADLDARYEEWLESARKAGGQAILFSTQDIINDYDPERYVFTVVRDIKEVFTRESVGMIAIDANISMIEEVVMDLDLTTKGKTILLDSMNKVIFDSERKLITQDFSRHEVLAEMNEAKGSFSAMINGAEHLVVYTSSKRNGWKMVVTVPLVELTEKVAEIQRVMIIITTSIIAWLCLS